MENTTISRRQQRKNDRRNAMAGMTEEAKRKIVMNRLNRIESVPSEYDPIINYAKIVDQETLDAEISVQITKFRKYLRDNFEVSCNLEDDLDDDDDDLLVTPNDGTDAPDGDDPNDDDLPADDGTDDPDADNDPTDYKKLYTELLARTIADKKKRSTDELNGFIESEMQGIGFSDAQIMYFINHNAVDAMISDDGTYKPNVFDGIRERIDEFSVISRPNGGTSVQYVDPSPGNGFKSNGRPASVSKSDYGRKLYERIRKDGR